MMAETTYLHVTHAYNLSQACRPLVDAFGWSIFLVGSALQRRDWHDIDVRCILDDDEFARMFPLGSTDPRLSLLNAALSEWLKARTGLPIDFQFQGFAANAEYDGKRSSLGVFANLDRGHDVKASL